jgi:tRNA nucleotidyltransferase (CCA-adding enzyme)
MVGLLLRNKAVHNVNIGADWTTSLLFALVQELVPHYDVLSDRLDGMYRSSCRSLFDNHVLQVSPASELIESYNTFVGKVEALRLPETLDAKPLLDVRAHHLKKF